jgi:hypothetical protein
MGVRKSPRIVIMNYSYRIEIGSVTEFEDDLYNGNWSFSYLIGNNNDFLMTNHMEVVNSFNRTKKWILENHVELLL